MPRPHLARRLLLCIGLSLVPTVSVAWIGCFLAAPVRHNHTITAGGQEWNVMWGGNAALRWESLWAVQVSPALERTLHIEGSADDRLLARIEQTAAALPTDNFAQTPLARGLHLDLAPSVQPEAGSDTGIVVRLAGWPAPALCGWQSASITARTTTEERRGLLQLPGTKTLLPFRPLPFGLAINLILYTALFAAAFHALGRLRGALRRRRQRCAQCSYDLRGLSPRDKGAITCPECGTPAPA